MSSATPWRASTTGCLLMVVWTQAGTAQTVDTRLSLETQQYVTQYAGEVLRKLTSQVTRTSATDFTSCPVIPAEGVEGLTNDHYYFLSEIGGCAQLACFLKQVSSSVHANSTLIVDQVCSGTNAIKETLVLPNRFTLAGVGIDGAGALGFDPPGNGAGV